MFTSSVTSDSSYSGVSSSHADSREESPLASLAGAASSVASSVLGQKRSAQPSEDEPVVKRPRRSAFTAPSAFGVFAAASQATAAPEVLPLPAELPLPMVLTAGCHHLHLGMRLVLSSGANLMETLSAQLALLATGTLPGAAPQPLSIYEQGLHYINLGMQQIMQSGANLGEALLLQLSLLQSDAPQLAAVHAASAARVALQATAAPAEASQAMPAMTGPLPGFAPQARAVPAGASQAVLAMTRPSPVSAPQPTATSARASQVVLAMTRSSPAVSLQARVAPARASQAMPAMTGPSPAVPLQATAAPEGAFQAMPAMTQPLPAFASQATAAPAGASQAIPTGVQTTGVSQSSVRATASQNDALNRPMVEEERLPTVEQMSFGPAYARFLETCRSTGKFVKAFRKKQHVVMDPANRTFFAVCTKDKAMYQFPFPSGPGESVLQYAKGVVFVRSSVDPINEKEKTCLEKVTMRSICPGNDCREYRQFVRCLAEARPHLPRNPPVRVKSFQIEP